MNLTNKSDPFRTEYNLNNDMFRLDVTESIVKMESSLPFNDSL